MPGARTYLLTWTCYGSWLHGDERLSVDRDHNVFRTVPIAPDPRREADARDRLKFDQVLLDDESRALVDGVIRAHCEHRGWTLHALNVRTNHVHVVLSCARHTPEQAMDQLKGWGTRVLRNHGKVGPQCHTWTGHGSTRYLWDSDSVSRAVEYVLNGQ